MQKKLKFCLIPFLFSFSSVFAQGESPLGYWQTYDLQHTPRSIIKFSVVNHELQGQIIKILPTQGETANALCTQCQGIRKNQPKLGMVVIWGLKKQGNLWQDGHILNPDTGEIYQGQLTVSNDNRILHLRAYLGTPVLGRTVDWERVKLG